ncbi:MAG: hypothetical protein ABFS43_01670 [Thermodesulfobacteriota bacterium]
MKTNAKMMVIGLVLAIVFCYAGPGLAETSIGTGAAASAAVNLNFQVSIQNYIEFRVGTDGSLDTINFSPGIDDLNNSSVVAGENGDLGSGRVSVRLLSNTPSIIITATNNTPSGLVNNGDFIDWESITTTEVTGGQGSIAPPLLTNAGSTTSTTPLNGAQNILTSWAYTYTRRAGDPIPTEDGAYTGQVTYTASTP